MGKPGYKNQSAISNVFRKSGGAYDVSKDRYTDPIVPGVGSPYDQTAWQDFKKGVKKVAGKAKGYVETNYPKVAETLTSIGESSIFNPNKPNKDGWTYSNPAATGPLTRTKGDSLQVSKPLGGWKTIQPKSSNKQTSSSVTVKGMGVTPGSSEGTITSRWQGDKEVPLTPADKRKNKRSAKKERKAKKKNN